MGSMGVRDAAALLGYGFLGLGGFSFWVLSSVEKNLWMSFEVFSVLF
jgi:hypothetical protein